MSQQCSYPGAYSRKNWTMGPIWERLTISARVTSTALVPSTSVTLVMLQQMVPSSGCE